MIIHSKMIKWRNETIFSLTAALIALLYCPTLIAETIAGNCNPLKVITCSLPFPSDLFSEQDASSPTGKRIIIPNDTLEILKNETDENPVDVKESMRPEALFANTSGFSAASPILFELERPADEASIPTDGGNVIRVFELGNPASIPVNVQVMEPARTKRVARKDTVIEAWPVSRWQFGKRYVAVLTTDIKPLIGGRYVRSEGVDTVLSESDAILNEAHHDILPFLDEQLATMNMDREHILSLTHFTVRDRAEVILPIANLAQRVYTEDHPIKNWKVTHHPFKYKAVTVEGKVRLTNFRSPDGGLIFDPSYPGEDNWVAFRLTIPNNADKKPAPIVLYGHGITATKETMTSVDQINAIKNIATFAIDQPNHGTRTESDNGYVMDILSSGELQKVIGMVSQSSIDMVSALAAIEQHISQIDVLPHNTKDEIFPWLSLRGKDGIPDIDTSKIFYEGTSMGGVLGSTFMGISPQIDGAFLHVSGVGVLNILTHSMLWGEFEHMAPEDTLGAEVASYMGMLQQSIDYGDGINFIDHAKHGSNSLPYRFEPYPVGMVFSLGDGVVFNNSSIALSSLAELPVATPAASDIYPDYVQLPLTKLPENQWFDEDGNGVRMIKPTSIPIGENSLLGQIFSGLLSTANAGIAHVSFSNSAGKEYQQAWTENHIQTYFPTLLVENNNEN